jgi:hypothetical protein
VLDQAVVELFGMLSFWSPWGFYLAGWLAELVGVDVSAA